MHFYPFNVKDYTYDTQHLTLAEHGALRLLIDRYHLIEKPLDVDEENIFRLMHFDKEEDKEVIRRMLKEFFVKGKKGWNHKQGEANVRAYKNRHKTAKERADLRWQRKKRESALLTINQEPLTNKQEQKNTLSIEDESFLKTFETFWDKYPKKSDKEKAKKIWLKDKPNIDEVLKAIQWQKFSPEWETENGRFIPYPSKYLLDQRWKDEVERDWTVALVRGK